MATSPATVGASSNLKAGVDRPDREEPRLNPSFREFARHYNVAVLPARSGQATDKAKIEATVGAIPDPHPAGAAP